MWGRFYSWDMHPKTPRVGMLHATLVVQFYEDGTGAAVGWLGIMNGTRVDEDMERLSTMVDEHFATAGANPKLFRMLMMRGTDDTVAEFRRRPDAAGVSFYGPPVFKGDVARSYEFVSTLFGKFTDRYLDLVEKHQKDMGTAEDRRGRTRCANAGWWTSSSVIPTRRSSCPSRSGPLPTCRR